MNINTTPFELLPGYVLVRVPASDFESLKRGRSSVYFAASSPSDVEVGLSADEQALIESRRNTYVTSETIYWFIMYGTDVVGWCHLQQADPDTLTMRNTAIDPAHRRKGLYTALLPIVINHARSEGYQRIVSTHHASNNAVIIPKLKAGFIITGLHINEKYGAMITLAYYVYEGRLRSAQERIGHVPHD
jgi:RimJ/RimL family protein N-acetyltransferase